MLTTNIRGLILLLFKEVLRLLRSQYCAVRSETTKGSWDRELCLRLPETARNRFVIKSKQGYFFAELIKQSVFFTNSWHKKIIRTPSLWVPFFKIIPEFYRKFEQRDHGTRYRLILDLIPGVVAPAPGVYFDSDKGGTDVCKICY